MLVAVTAVLLAGEPEPLEHEALRWLGAEELDAVRLLAPDVPFLPQLRTLLEEGS